MLARAPLLSMPLIISQPCIFLDTLERLWSCLLSLKSGLISFASWLYLSVIIHGSCKRVSLMIFNQLQDGDTADSQALKAYYNVDMICSYIAFTLLHFYSDCGGLRDNEHYSLPTNERYSLKINLTQCIQ